MSAVIDIYAAVDYAADAAPYAMLIATPLMPPLTMPPLR